MAAPALTLPRQEGGGEKGQVQNGEAVKAGLRDGEKHVKDIMPVRGSIRAGEGKNILTI
jgi:hypothetical protein